MNETDFAVECLETFGEEAQIDKAIEECLEFALELTKAKKGKLDMRHLASEMADLQFCPVKQITIMMDAKSNGEFSKMVQVEKDYKMSRTKLLLEKYKKD